MLKDYAEHASMGIFRGLYQELKIIPGKHYFPRADNSSRVVVVTLRGINPHYLSSITGMTKQLNMFAGLDDTKHIRIGWSGHNILLEIPKPLKYWKQVTIEQLEDRHAIRRGPIATIGLNLQEKPMRVSFKEDFMAHLFITGQTRSGKTNTQRLIGWNLAHNTTPQDAKMVIFDVAKKGYNWSDFSNVANLGHPVITQANEADKVLTWASLEIERRAEQRYVTPKLFILIDELKALTDDSKVATQYLSRIASTGGEFGLHLILSTQYPQIKMLGNAELKRNITTRLCGKVDDAASAANALGVTGSGAESLQGYGDFLLKNNEGLTRLTVAKIEKHHIAKLPHGEIEHLLLPDDDQVNNGPPATKQPDCIEPEQAALALFRPMGINRLAGELSIGSTKAKRVKEFAEAQRRWAVDNGYKINDNHGWTEFEYYDPIPHLD